MAAGRRLVRFRILRGCRHRRPRPPDQRRSWHISPYWGKPVFSVLVFDVGASLLLSRAASASNFCLEAFVFRGVPGRGGVDYLLGAVHEGGKFDVEAWRQLSAATAVMRCYGSPIASVAKSRPRNRIEILLKQPLAKELSCGSGHAEPRNAARGAVAMAASVISAKGVGTSSDSLPSGSPPKNQHAL
jgi:hypothetical protein